MGEYFKLRVDEIPCLNVGLYLMKCMRDFDSNSVALIDGSTDKSYTYAELVSRTERAAAGLQKYGVLKGDLICIALPNHTDYVVAFYASALIGATFQPINPLYTKDDITKVVKEYNTKYFMTVPSLLPKVKEALLDSENIKIIVFGEADGYTSFESLIDSSDRQYTSPPCDPKTDVVALMSSSGTTGFPKAVKMSHYSLVANALQMKSAGLYAPGETYVVFLPLFHAYGLYMLTLTIHCLAGRIVLMSKFQPDDYLRLIEKYKPTILHTVPPIMVMFSKYPKVSDYDLSSVKTVLCGAAPLSQEIEEKVKTRLNLKCIFQGYGMTEVGVTHMNGKHDFRYKSVGKLLPLVEMKIVDVSSGKPCGVNEEGEIWIKGPQLSLGYLNLPDENKILFTDDGWAKTGDIGREDEDGYLFVVDRLKELIKYKAYQVAPATLEDILLTHDAVADAGVVGVPDEDAGELPRAYVVKKPGHEVNEEEIISYVENKVAPHMKLHGGVEFIDEIPRTASGKILRKSLREKAKSLTQRQH